MAEPTDRPTFAARCLRTLGDGVITINVSPDQVDDRIDDALAYYWDYHFDGAERNFYKYQLTDTDLTNQYLPVPENVLGITKMYPIGNAINTNSIFDIRYQIALNDLYAFSSTSLVPYFMTFQQLQFMEQMLVGQQNVRFNRHQGKVMIDMDWDMVEAGDWLVFDCYNIVDPDIYPLVWKDRWLQRYATCLIKKQWASNLQKFKGMKMPDGIEFNAGDLYSQAQEEQAALEKEMIYTYGLPVSDLIG